MILAVESFNKIYIIFALVIVGIASAITYVKVFQKHKMDEKKQKELLHNEKIINNPDEILKRKDEYIDEKEKFVEQNDIDNEQVINDNQQNYIDQENQDNEDNSFKDNNMF